MDPDRCGEGDSLGLTGRVAIVTGSSEGIGRAVAATLARFGCRVVISGRRPALVEAAVAAIGADGGVATGVPVDVGEQAGVDRLVEETMGSHGRIDILVNNVGGSFGEGFRRGPLLELSDGDVMNVMRANVLTMLRCCRAAMPQLRAHGDGSIVNISSVVVRTPMPGFGAYGAAKAAVNHLTEALAGEVAPEVRVNAVLAGHVDTERARRNRTDDDVTWLERHIDMGRLGEPKDVAGAVAFLASPLARWVTGACVAVDGGVRAV